MEKELPKRKPLRLKDFDYNTPGTYFITICTHNRKCTLSHIEGDNAIYGIDDEPPKIKLTEYGKITDNVINNIPQRLGVTVDRYVIMPNHVHFILAITNDEVMRAPQQIRSIISKTIGYIKMNVSKEIRNKYGNISVWQRGYHDHVIRNTNDYEKTVMYIYKNPVKWQFDRFYPKESQW